MSFLSVCVDLPIVGRLPEGGTLLLCTIYDLLLISLRSLSVLIAIAMENHSQPRVLSLSFKPSTPHNAGKCNKKFAN